ncbi:MAG: pilus assembly protein PilM [Elusimicrobia bacterium]|nr:pilus assembly protein PilM [Elusimicrobiota bacterium]
MKLYTGLDLRDNTIRIVQMRKDAGKWQLVNIFHEAVENKTEVREKLKEIASRYKIKNTVLYTSVSKQDVFVKYLSLPPGEKPEIRKMMDFEIEKYIPFPAEKAITDFDLLPNKPENPDRPNVFFVAANSGIIREHFDILSYAGLIPEAIGITSLANFNSFVYNIESKNCFGLIDIGRKTIEISIISDGILCFSRSFSIGESALGEFSHWFDEFLFEIKSSLDVFGKSSFGCKPEKIYLCGDCSKLEDIKSLLHKNLKLDVEKFNIFDKIDTGLFNSSEPVSDPEIFSVAVGSILNTELFGIKVNLIPPEVIDRRRKLKKRKNILVYGIAGFLMLFSVLFLAFRDTYTKITEIRTLDKKIEQLKPAVKGAEKIINQFGVFEEFSHSGIIPLNILSELSTVLPSNLYLTQFFYDKDKSQILIKGRTNSFLTASKLPILLAKSGIFSGVTGKSSKEIKFADKQLVEFEIECSVNYEIK